MVYKQVIQCGDREVQYFLNNGWEIIASAPNPSPEPFIYFFVSREVMKRMCREEILKFLDYARAEI